MIRFCEISFRKSLRTILSCLFLMAFIGQRASAEDICSCADPGNLPFSNQKLEGFENKIAQLVADTLKLPLSYYWFAHQRGLVRNTLKLGKCNVIIGVPSNWGQVLTTKPYYRTSYVMVYKKDRGLSIQSLNDPVLKTLKIGVLINSPPHQLLAERGIIENVVGYSPFFDPIFHPEESPGKVVEDVMNAKIDVGLVWGPVAGFYIKKRNFPLVMIPLTSDNPRFPVTFDISMGVRKGDQELKKKLDQVIDLKHVEIQHILEEYGVPVLQKTVSVGKEIKTTQVSDGSLPLKND
ncbi:substrate-binding domain-containing protein [Methylacidiphilum caldifontis]|uniref:substrate-binding domain-containing protein n=1 Tax=Methylacidiphilum caldifontis TaxID=2795386 RepID=UPI001A8C3729|nr:substrate-binding domain-containing protein [Methylacidiphilum caldifontis]QSR89033.1 substrate-binding domain-containing protein [Methylacidiphilum caldifontis]